MTHACTTLAYAAVLALLFPLNAAQAQWLPTQQAGDHGNGAATSDATGAFIEGAAARSEPAVAFGVPTAFGADARDVFAAAGYQHRLRDTEDAKDGAVFAGFGLGNAHRWSGAEFTLAFYDLKTNEGQRGRDEPFRDGSVSVKLHRRVTSRVAVAAGIENAVQFGETDGGRSAYAVVSGLLPVGQPGLERVTGTVGVGNGRFNTVDRVKGGTNGVSLFGSLGVRVARPVGVLASWTGQDLNVGLSLAPLRFLPLVVTPALLDVAGTSDDAQSGARFAVSVGVALTLP